MPEISSAQSPGPLLLPHHSDTLAQAIAHQFANRPTLRQVVAQQLRERIQEHYPPLALDMRSLNGKDPVLLCSPQGDIETFVSMDALVPAFGAVIRNPVKHHPL
ncbi:hypothetical protein [Pseudomonas fluorescens]|uniref:hypothetical protein n=1 Tax=Pseudomonas fluorescens TaxID=294 RepID=UPI001BEC8A1D|nr:hypothetical protein [Pseudomonas fluorescens]MBT2372265.1 hypothetical protein [Pseudomonas fluorescens]